MEDDHSKDQMENQEQREVIYYFSSGIRSVAGAWCYGLWGNTECQ